MIRNRISWIAALIAISSAGTAYAQEEAPAAGDEAAVEGQTEGDANASMEVGTEGEGDVAADADAEADTTMGGDAVPMAYTNRGLTLPKGTLRIDFAPADRAMLNSGVEGRAAGASAAAAIAAALAAALGGGLVDIKFPGPAVSTPGFGVGGGSGLDASITATLGAGFGIIDNLEAGAILLPLQLAPSGVDTFGDISLYGRYRFVEGNTEVAGQVSVQIPTQSEFGFGVGLPVKFHLGDNMHLNTGVNSGFLMDSAVDSKGKAAMLIALGVPLEWAINVMPAFFLGLGTGMHTALSPDAFKNIAVPLNLFAGYTLAFGDKMLLDITGQFGFPAFLNITDIKGDDTLNTKAWQIVGGATFHYGVM